MLVKTLSIKKLSRHKGPSLTLLSFKDKEGIMHQKSIGT